MLASPAMRSGGNAIFAALTALLGAALLLGEPWLFWVGAGAVVAAASALAAALWGVIPRPELGRLRAVSVGLFAAFALWSGASILWSEAPDRSWDFFNRALVYLSFLALGTFVWRRRLADALAALIGITIAWALFEKVFALADERRARLNEPVGYWNTLGLLAATAIPLALRLRSRLAGCLLLYGAVVAILLTQSRGALLLAIVAAAVWLVVERERYEPALRLALAVPPGIFVGALGLALNGVSKDAHPEALEDGLVLGAALVVVGAAVAWVSRFDLPAARRARALRTAAYVVVPVVAGALRSR